MHVRERDFTWCCSRLNPRTQSIWPRLAAAAAASSSSSIAFWISSTSWSDVAPIVIACGRVCVGIHVTNWPTHTPTHTHTYRHTNGTYTDTGCQCYIDRKLLQAASTGEVIWPRKTLHERRKHLKSPLAAVDCSVVRSWVSGRPKCSKVA